MWRVFLIVILLCFVADRPAFANMQVVPGAPSGFEKLDEPRPAFVTLYYGGELLGHFPARYTSLLLAFDTPLPIIDALPDIEDVAAVGSMLASPMPTNRHLVCGARRTEDCGRFEPPVAGIIFDENRMSAELFINRAYLSLSEQNAARYLPLPARNFSSVYRFDGAVNGSDANEANFALGNQAVFAFGEGNLTTQTTLSNQGLRFDTVSAGVERQGWAASGGLMRSQAMQLASDRDIAGFSFSTSLRTRLDARKIEGNDIILYLPRQSFVSIYREGRLYSSRNYEAGNQRIDTTELPDGAYSITLKIQETDGAVREETRFFAKSEQIPPPDAPTYYVQGGVLRAPASQDSAVPEFMGKPLLRAGTVHRVGDNVGLSLGMLGISDRAAAEASAFMLTDGSQLRATAFSSTRGDVGTQTSLLYLAKDWNAAVDARKLWAGDALPKDYGGLLAGITQLGATLSYMPLPELTLSARGSYAKSDGMPALTSYGPAVMWRLWQAGESSLYFSGDAARANGRNQGTAGLRFSYRMGAYGISGDGGGIFGGNSPGAFGSARVWHESKTTDESLLTGAGIRGDARSRAIGADADWRSSYGRVQGSVQQSYGDMQALTYGGNFSLGAAQTDDMVHLGGHDTAASAVVVEASGDAQADMNIYINSTLRGTVAVGGRQVIYLSPYNIYRVRLSPAKKGLFRVDEGERKVTLYPGNVTRLEWEVSRFNVVVAKLATPDGTPMANAVLQENRANVATDARGRFQAEIALVDSLEFITESGDRCRVSLPPDVQAVNGVLLYREPLVCK